MVASAVILIKCSLLCVAFHTNVNSSERCYSRSRRGAVAVLATLAEPAATPATVGVAVAAV